MKVVIPTEIQDQENQLLQLAGLLDKQTLMIQDLQSQLFHTQRDLMSLKSQVTVLMADITNLNSRQRKLTAKIRQEVDSRLAPLKLQVGLKLDQHLKDQEQAFQEFENRMIGLPDMF